MMKLILTIFLVTLCLAASAQAEGNIADGASVFKSKCGTCHAVDQNRIGPKLNHIVGRNSASVPDFQYSPALQTAGLVWDETTLDKWLTSPSTLVAGTRMTLRLNNVQDRIDVIAYLKTLTAP